MEVQYVVYAVDEIQVAWDSEPYYLDDDPNHEHPVVDHHDAFVPEVMGFSCIPVEGQEGVMGGSLNLVLARHEDGSAPTLPTVGDVFTITIADVGRAN